VRQKNREEDQTEKCETENREEDQTEKCETEK
jgi:hypothetical protein